MVVKFLVLNLRVHGVGVQITGNIVLVKANAAALLKAFAR